MIVSKTPLRISFIGGGTDIKEYYRNNSYGAVISATIDKYIYISVNKRFDNTIKASYSTTEIVNSADEIKHPIIRCALKLIGIDTGIEIISIADVPSKTGLGSSSSFTVGLLNALYAYIGVSPNADQLAKEACEIEIDILNEPIGKQDQYAAAFGGINYIQFNDDDSVCVEPIKIPRESIFKLNENLMMFYTGITRSARVILQEQVEKIAVKNDYYQAMKALTNDVKAILSNENQFKLLGELLDKGWMMKRELAATISCAKIDEFYNIAKQNDALGGKLLGAGGGGFLLFYCEKPNQERLKEILGDLKWIPFRFEPLGSIIAYKD
jgi:D-glycero-alpha-D-manno-heptose-7-phosphate kinase